MKIPHNPKLEEAWQREWVEKHSHRWVAQADGTLVPAEAERRDDCVFFTIIAKRPT